MTTQIEFAIRDWLRSWPSSSRTNERRTIHEMHVSPPAAFLTLSGTRAGGRARIVGG